MTDSARFCENCGEELPPRPAGARGPAPRFCSKVTCNATYRKMKTVRVITRMMYGWSKYGGGNEGMMKEELEEWNCQCCGEKQTKDLPSYFIPLDVFTREFMRVCSACKHEAVVRKITTISTLIEKIRFNL